MKVYSIMLITVLFISCAKKTEKIIFMAEEKNIEHNENSNSSMINEIINVDNYGETSETDNLFELKSEYWFYKGTLPVDKRQSIKLCFDLENNSYKFKISGSGVTIVEGIFEIKNNKICLTPNYIYYDEPDADWYLAKSSILEQEWELEAVNITDSPYFTKGFVYRDQVFADTDSKPHQDSIIVINGIRMIVLETAYGRVKENIRVRTGPSNNYDYYLFKYYHENNDNYLVAQTSVIILARSMEIDTQNDLSGYWYYCDLALLMDVELLTQEGESNKEGHAWIFGPLIDFK